MALATRTDRKPSPPRTFWGSTIGKKTVMAVSGLIMLGYLVAHVLGNLKVFFGPGEFNGYAHWLRTLGEPFLHYEWALWGVRLLLVAAVVAHAVSAYQLSRRDIKARPDRYVHRRKRASYATRTMRWGGIIVALFIVWHLLDLTTLTVNERAQPGHPTRTSSPPSPPGTATSSTSSRCWPSACTSDTASGVRPRRSASATPPGTAHSRPSQAGSRWC